MFLFEIRNSLLILLTFLILFFALPLITFSESYEQSKIIASDGDADDGFGLSTAVYGDTVVVGAPYDNDNGENSGSVYVYYWNGFNWEETKITSRDGSAGDQFGSTVSIDHNVIVIGAHGDDDNGSKSGSVYIYKKVDNSWDESKLIAIDGSNNDYFGYSVSIDNNTIIVGSPFDDDNGLNTGSAYLYDLIGDEWILNSKLVANNSMVGDHFGFSVAIDKGLIVIGAYGSDIYGHQSGLCYLYQRNGSLWTESQIFASNLTDGDNFGFAVDVDNNNIAIGSRFGDDNGYNSGTSYIYVWDGITWDENKLLASDGERNEYYGSSISIDGNKIISGSYNDDVFGLESGSAYIYNFIDKIWNETKLVPNDGAAEDQFGKSVAINGDTIVVGAPFDDDNGSNSGSV
jgi:hypothetical protein